jgi:brevican
MNDWASMGDFVWSDGEPVGYDNWNPGEPQGVGERAVAIMLLGGGNSWADAPDVRSR